MLPALRAIYKYWSALIFIAVLVQIGAAGYGAFYSANHLKDKGDTFDHKGFDHGWSFHTGLGWVLVYAIVVLLVIGLVARIGRPWIWLTLALAVAGVLQTVFAFLGEDHPAAGFLHPLDALAIFVLSGANAHRAWRRSAPA